MEQEPANRPRGFTIQACKAIISEMRWCVRILPKRCLLGVGVPDRGQNRRQRLAFMAGSGTTIRVALAGRIPLGAGQALAC